MIEELRDLHRRIEALRDVGDDYLILSTIHSAKGQEWTAVYVLNVVDGCIPSDMSTGTVDDIEEERRLLYVAMTRAKKRLELPSKCFGLKECFDANKETGDFFHVPDLRPRNQDRGRFQEQPEDPDFD